MSTTAPPPETSLAHKVSTLAKRLTHMGNGPRAEMRRLRADADDRWRSATFYRIYADTIDPAHTGSEQHEAHWAMILAGLARLDHRAGLNAGATLAEHGFSERRLVRLLDADEDHLPSELRAAVSFLAAKGTEVNWISLADLVLTNQSDRRDEVRRKIAAAYYRSLAKSTSAKA